MELINHRESESLDFYGSCSIPSVELSIETPRNLNLHHPPSAFGHISGYLVVQHSHIIGMRKRPRRAPRHRRAPAGDGKARQTRAATEGCNAGSDAFSVEGFEASHGQKDKTCGEC